jgi:hypothetical protein
MPPKLSVRTICILSLVALLGFIGVRLIKPFLEGYWAYSGPGSIAGMLSWLSHDIDNFKKDHGGNPPALVGMWDILLNKSDSTELGNAPAKGTSCGPYLSFAPINALNRQSAVSNKPAPGIGWVYVVKGNEFKLSAVNAAGTAVLSDDEAHLYYFRETERRHVAAQRAWNNWAGLVFGVPLLWYLLKMRILRPSREALRIDKGLCGNCAYDLQAHMPGDRCPECGTVVPSPFDPPVASPWVVFLRQLLFKN